MGFCRRKFSEPELQEEMKRIDGLKFVEMPDGLVGVEVMQVEPRCVTTLSETNRAKNYRAVTAEKRAGETHA